MYRARYRLQNDENRKYAVKWFTEWDELKSDIGILWDNIAILNFYPKQNMSRLSALPNKAEYWPKNIHVLFLNGNNITKVPDIKGYWPDKIKSISLSFNNIKNLPNNWPPNLSGLYLIGNQIEQINCCFPQKLTVLNLANNFISALPNDINYWPIELMYLNVSHNSILSLPVNLKRMLHLVNLICLDNPININVL